MKSRLSFIILSGALTFLAPVYAQEGQQHHGAEHQTAASNKVGNLVPVTEKDAAWAAKARKEYPLDVCVTSDEKLGAMGKSPEYIFRVAGQPDRLVVFCCDGCEDDFLKAPAKYLAKLDAAKKGNGKSTTKSDHKGHH
jgi:hypothetical protein